MAEPKSRREFALTVATLAAAVPFLDACARAAPGAEASPVVPTPVPSGTPAAPAAPELSVEARAMQDIVRARYGPHIDPEQLEAVLTDVAGVVQRAERLRQAPLRQALEPAHVFGAFRAER